jgi:hypothetical protein
LLSSSIFKYAATSNERAQRSKVGKGMFDRASLLKPLRPYAARLIMARKRIFITKEESAGSQIAGLTP